jgi:hypothetical protein
MNRLGKLCGRAFGNTLKVSTFAHFQAIDILLIAGRDLLCFCLKIRILGVPSHEAEHKLAT